MKQDQIKIPLEENDTDQILLHNNLPSTSDMEWYGIAKFDMQKLIWKDC